MKFIYKLLKDLFNIALGTWLVLLFLELVNSGMVIRYINLEYYFYILIVLFIINRLEK